MLADAGFDHLDAKAGCARCQACSGLSAWERVHAARGRRRMSTISSSARVRWQPSAGSPRRRRAGGALRRAPGHLRRGAGALRGRRPRRARRVARTRCTRSAWSTARSSARCGCTRSATGCGRATGSRCCPGARAPARRGAGAASPSRTAGERGGDAMVAQIQLPNVRFFEQLGWRADGAPARYHGVMHQPMAICATRPVSGVAGEVPGDGSSPPAASFAAARMSSKRAARPRRRGRARSNTAHAARVSARGEQEAEARERQQPAFERRAVRARERVQVERRAAAGALDHLQQRAGDARHRDVARGVGEAVLGDLHERLAVGLAGRSGRGRAAP